MRVVVDRDLCEANGVCTRIAPELFQLGDDDQLRVPERSILPEQVELVRAAVRRCPRQALGLIDAASG